MYIVLCMKTVRKMRGCVKKKRKKKMRERFMQC